MSGPGGRAPLISSRAGIVASRLYPDIEGAGELVGEEVLVIIKETIDFCQGSSLGKAEIKGLKINLNN